MNVGTRKSVSSEMRLAARHEGSEAASQEVVCRNRVAGKGVLTLTYSCSDCTHLYSSQLALMGAFTHRSELLLQELFPPENHLVNIHQHTTEKRNSKCKGPEVRVCLAEEHLGRLGRTRGKFIGDRVRGSQEQDL